MRYKDYAEFIWALFLLFVGISLLCGLFTSHPQW